MGASKAAATLVGRPLIARPLEALAAVCAPVAVVCKRSTRLPELPGGVERWDEPDEPRHPLTGIVHALERAGAPVLVCAADMPFVDSATCGRLIAVALGDSAAVVASGEDGRLQPVLAVYGPAALDGLRAADPDAPLTATVEGLRPTRVVLPAELLESVNTPEELAEAEARLSS